MDFTKKSEQKAERAKPSVLVALIMHGNHKELYTLALKLVTSCAEGCSFCFFAYHKVALSIIYTSLLLLSEIETAHFAKPRDFAVL